MDGSRTDSIRVFARLSLCGCFYLEHQMTFERTDQGDSAADQFSYSVVASTPSRDNCVTQPEISDSCDRTATSIPPTGSAGEQQLEKTKKMNEALPILIDGPATESPATPASPATDSHAAMPMLNALWRSTALVHQIGVLTRGDRPFRNIPVKDAEGAVTTAAHHSGSGSDCYIACAEYRTPDNRKAVNAVGSWAFWLDVDCGADKAAAGKGYLDTATAAGAISEFCQGAGLPQPTFMLSSGGGLQVFWALDRRVDAADWTGHAEMLKALTNKLSLLADPSRTADIASVMRMPGTFNYKYKPPRLVTVASPQETALDRDSFLQAISDAHDRLCGAPTPRRSAQVQHPSTSPASSPPNLRRLAAALKFLDPSCSEVTWKLKRLAPMAKAARDFPELAAPLKAMAREWSSGLLGGVKCRAWTEPGASNGVTGQEAFEGEWLRFSSDHYTGAPTTLGTIYHDAKEAGWKDETEAFEVVTTTDSANIEEQELTLARQATGELIAKVKAGDIEAVLEPSNVTAMAYLRNLSRAEYLRERRKLKEADRRVPLADLDEAVKAMNAAATPAQTHHGYAEALLGRLKQGGWSPVSHGGSLYVADPSSGLWLPKDQAQLEREVALGDDGKPNCSRRADYTAVALHATSLVSDQQFFADAPVGLACPGGFYRIVGSETVVEPLRPEHRQRFSLHITPAKQATPLFTQFLRETFASPIEGDEEQQVALLQEIAGAVILGVMHRYQKAVLFYDSYGRAGKGTFDTILRQLVPATFVTAVDPFKWDDEYYMAALVGARLNVVGELSEHAAIPAAIFKSVLGGDHITGRHPSQRPVVFKNEAAHLFMSNHLIHTRDQSEAFFARWLIVEFPNSRLRSGLPQDPDVAKRIIESELPGVAQWALDGAARLIRNKRFSWSQVHDRLMENWRRGSNSLMEFIHEECQLGGAFWVRRSDFYAKYKNWCAENGRKAFAKGRVKELLEHDVRLGVWHTKLDGYETFRGVQIRADQEDDGALLKI